jgi:hypothetical protein
VSSRCFPCIEGTTFNYGFCVDFAASPLLEALSHATDGHAGDGGVGFIVFATFARLK